MKLWSGRKQIFLWIKTDVRTTISQETRGCSSNVVGVALPMENAAKMNKSRRSISLNIDRIYIHGSSGIPARSRFGHFCSDHWHPLKIVSTVRVAKYRRVARRRTVIARRRVNIIKIFMTSARWKPRDAVSKQRHSDEVHRPFPPTPPSFLFRNPFSSFPLCFPRRSFVFLRRFRFLPRTVAHFPSPPIARPTLFYFSLARYAPISIYVAAAVAPTVLFRAIFTAGFYDTCCLFRRLKQRCSLGGGENNKWKIIWRE